MYSNKNVIIIIKTTFHHFLGEMNHSHNIELTKKGI